VQPPDQYPTPHWPRQPPSPMCASSRGTDIGLHGHRGVRHRAYDMAVPTPTPTPTTPTPTPTPTPTLAHTHSRKSPLVDAHRSAQVTGHIPAEGVSRLGLRHGSDVVRSARRPTRRHDATVAAFWVLFVVGRCVLTRSVLNVVYFPA
jgi:hypothetical protein